MTLRHTALSINDALFYLNDSLNVKYCRPGDEYGESLYFVDTIRIEVDANDEIAETDLRNVMDSMAVLAGNQYYSVTGTKAPFMFIVRQASNIVNDSIDFGVTFVMEKGAPVSTESYPYSLSWPYGFDGAFECNESQEDEDAADLFRRDLRNATKYEPSPKTESYYFRDAYIVCFTPVGGECYAEEIMNFELRDEILSESELINPNDPTANDNLNDYLLFYNWSGNSNYDECLSVSEMNWYFEAMEELIEDQLGTIQVGSRVVANVEVGYLFLATGNSTIDHDMIAIYAIKANPIGASQQESLPSN